MNVPRLTRRTALGLLLAGPALAAPAPQPWPKWETSGEAAGIDHAAWDGFLRRHVVTGADGINRVSYAEVTPEERDALRAWLGRMAALRITGFVRPEQLAYWINLYNALTVQVVLEHYPVSSIRRIGISPGLFSSGPWGARLITVEGEALSLDDIEHRILRPIWHDPRIHYAVNCASLGCPNLRAAAFTAANAEAALDQAARDYVNHPRGAAVQDGRLVVSSIYAWYRADFGGNDAGVIAHLRRFAAPPLAAALAGITRVDSDHYDWALNEART